MSTEQGVASQLPESRVWIGQDVSLKKNMLINPHEVAITRLVSHPGSFPDEIREYEEDRFSASLRSRYAQSGLHAANFATQIAVDSYLNAMDQTNFEFQFPITNLTDAPMFLAKDTRLLRFYIPPTEFIKNGELIELIKDREVHIDGKQDQDWQYVYKKIEKKTTEDIIGVALKVKENGRKYIPASREPISISGTEKHYRVEVDRFLRPVTGRPNPQLSGLWVGETVPLFLNEHIAGEIERDAYPGFVGNALRETTGEHINSRLIDPSTGWPVRVEIFSPTEGPNVVDWVIFKFFRQ